MAGAGSVASADGRWDALWTGVHLACMTDAAYGAIEDGALAVRDGRIAWLGRRRDLPAGVAPAAEHDGGGRWLTPALIDCHTHLVFGGDRADEFERRLGGESYESIARAGGGILSTVRATRAASEDELVAAAARRAAALAAEGVGTIEVKSGYGLDVESELKMLRAARRVAERVSVRVSTTCLALHALPPESRDDRAAYLRLVVDELLPRVAGERLADAVDVYCERIAFSRDECAAVLSRARALGLATRVHADQLSDGGGAALAAEFAARSAEHLEYASEAGVAAMARAGTVAVLLPGAYVLLRETQPPPVDALRRHGVPIAIATDCNPGTSPVTSLLAMLPLAAAAFRLTPAECLAGVTRHAARALGLDGELGTLEVGKRAEAVLWDVGHPRELAYWLGRNPLVARLRG